MKITGKYDIKGTRITFMDEPWFIERTTGEQGNGVCIIARNLIATRKGRNPMMVLLEDHIYNWNKSLNYGESVRLEGAKTFLNNNPRAMSEIYHSGYARPVEFDNPEWKDLTLADFAELLMSGKKNPLSRNLAEAKVEAILRYKNAPLPPQYIETARQVLRMFGPDIIWMAGGDANLEISRMAIEMEKSKQR